MNREALRLLDLVVSAHDAKLEYVFSVRLSKLRALLSAQEPTVEHWRQAVKEWRKLEREGWCAGNAVTWIEHQARELAKQEAK